MQEATTALAERPHAPHATLVKPVASVEDIAQAWQNYERLKQILLTSDDYHVVDNKPRIKKSGWRKIQTAFGISDEVVNEERKEHKSYFVYLITVKATAQNGRFAFSVGSCASNERRFVHVEHDVRSTAHTRAKNRAISDLVGGGEVSAEEIVAVPPTSAQDSPFAPVEYVEAPVEPQGASQEARNDWDDTTFNDRITDKQKHLLIKLIEARVQDEHDKNLEIKRVQSLSKREASNLISEMLGSQWLRKPTRQPKPREQHYIRYGKKVMFFGPKAFKLITRELAAMSDRKRRRYIKQIFSK